MVFIILLVFSTLAVAGSAAFFSVYGLAQIFSASFVPVVIMGSALEAGKLIAASYLYRYWEHTPRILKTYLFVAIFTLMVVTSLGIFGFLTAAYQTDSIGLKQQQEQITLYENQKVAYTERLNGINADIARTGDNYITKRIELIENFKQEKDQLIADIAETDAKLLELKSIVLQTEAKIGPIIYVAEVLDENPDKATFWFVVIIIAVFDPLAIALTLGSNIAIRQRWPVVEEEVPAVVKYDRGDGAMERIDPDVDEPMMPEVVMPEVKMPQVTMPQVSVKPVPEVSVPEIKQPTVTPGVTTIPIDTSEITEAIGDVKKILTSTDSSKDISKLVHVVDKLSEEVRQSNTKPNPRATGSHSTRIK